MNFVLLEGKWSVERCKNNPFTLFVFGDNLIGKGKGGQAVIRDCLNSYGVPTKRLPSMEPEAFFSDQEDEWEAIYQSLRFLYSIAPRYRQVAFPSSGLGTGLARMDYRSPINYCKMVKLLVEHFNIHW